MEKVFSKHFKYNKSRNIFTANFSELQAVGINVIGDLLKTSDSLDICFAMLSEKSMDEIIFVFEEFRLIGNSSDLGFWNFRITEESVNYFTSLTWCKVFIYNI